MGSCSKQRIARSAEMRGDELGVMERRIAGPRPSRMVHAVGLGSAQRIESADFVERFEMLGDRVGNLVLGEQLADRAVLPLRARPVVAPDVQHDRVVADAEFF